MKIINGVKVFDWPDDEKIINRATIKNNECFVATGIIREARIFMLQDSSAGLIAECALDENAILIASLLNIHNEISDRQEKTFFAELDTSISNLNNLLKQAVAALGNQDHWHSYAVEDVQKTLGHAISSLERVKTDYLKSPFKKK